MRFHLHPALALALASGGSGCAVLQRAPSVETVAGVSALRFGALVDGTGAVTRDAVVFVAGDTIVRIATGDRAIPQGIPVTDLRPLTAIPGMIDAHTHMTYWRDKINDPTGQRAPRSRDSIVMMASENALRTLETGVTTVRDLGAGNYNDIAMRDSINAGAMVGPRMFVAGFGLSKSGGGRGGTPQPARGQVRDTADLLPAIKAQVDAGADWIKMYGSTGSFQNVTGRQTFTNKEMNVAVRIAHQFQKPIAIHSYGDSGGRAAMRAGANSVEHPAGLDDATIAEWARTRTIYVPTVDHNRFYAENAALLRYNAQQVAALDSFRALNLESVRRAAKAGVKIAMGSDAVYWMHGENTHELRRFIEAGMTPAQALATATVNGAELLGMPRKLGRIARGYFADIVAVDGDPLADIEVVVTRVKWVMKGGKVVVDTR